MDSSEIWDKLRTSAPSFNDHRKISGIKYKRLPPMLQAIPEDVLKLSSWKNDDLPEFLWVASFMPTLSSASVRHPINSLKILNQYFLTNTPVPYEVPYITGWVSDFDNVPDILKAPLISYLEDTQQYEQVIPANFYFMLQLYEKIPGKWLLATNKKFYEDLDYDLQVSILSNTVEKLSPRHGKYALACIISILSNLVKDGRFKHAPSPDGQNLLEEKHINELNNFPNISDASVTELSVRLSMVMRMRLNLTHEKTWSALFWEENWDFFPCDSSLEIDEEREKETTFEGDSETENPQSDFSNFAERYAAAIEEDKDSIEVMLHWEEKVLKLQSYFETMAYALNPHKVGIDRWDVLTGIVGKALRTGAAIIISPAASFVEHAAPPLRMILESRIHLAYLIQEDIKGIEKYSMYKEYGRSQAKRVRMFYQENLERGSSSPTEDELKVLNWLLLLSNFEVSEDLQAIQLTQTFEGEKVLKEMALEVGLRDDYNYYYTLFSSFIHTDWFSIQQSSLEPCWEPLHSGHNVLRKNSMLKSEQDSDLQNLIFAWLADLVLRYQKAMEPYFTPEMHSKLINIENL